MFAYRVLLGLLLALAAAALILMFARPSSGAGPERSYRVLPGDTLWSIASAHYAGDPRSAIWRIEQRNGLADPGIAPGQVLILPGS
ncbi:MAG: LysM peptidoglycan-binding domain-containing protein [Actinobacteria bacterium]|nr:MAG: LysM peptidoglycan-binding domain-containing protein [Actinomycetota bacterium]